MNAGLEFGWRLLTMNIGIAPALIGNSLYILRWVTRKGVKVLAVCYGKIGNWVTGVYLTSSGTGSPGKMIRLLRKLIEVLNVRMEH